VGQRDILKSAADAASLAATPRLHSLPDRPGDDDMRDSVQSFARRSPEPCRPRETFRHAPDVPD